MDVILAPFEWQEAYVYVTYIKILPKAVKEQSKDLYNISQLLWATSLAIKLIIDTFSVIPAITKTVASLRHYKGSYKNYWIL